MSGGEIEDAAERRRQRKLEEALEVKSLRRIISAYLNYKQLVGWQVWINFGPLLYHFADLYGQEDEMSIELSFEDVKNIAFHYRFELKKEQTVETTYTVNRRSMMQNHYHAAFWTMRKKRTSAT